MKNLGIYIKLLQKRILDLKLAQRIRIFLFSTVIISTLLVGGIAYLLATDSVMENTEMMAINLIKQTEVNLDDRITSFKNDSYSLLQTSGVSKLFRYTKEEVSRMPVEIKSVFSDAIYLMPNLSKFTDYALLEVKDEVIYEYYRQNQSKLSQTEEKALLEDLKQYVNDKNLTAWVVKDGKVYFVRKTISRINEKSQMNGYICFAIHDSFFEFIGTDSELLKNDNLVILNSENLILKNGMELGTGIVETLQDYQSGQYHVYSATSSVKGERYLTIVLKTIQNRWKIIVMIPHAVLLQDVYRIMNVIIGIMLVVLVIVSAVTTAISRTLIRNLQVVEEGMTNIENGAFDIVMRPATYDEVGMLVPRLNYMGRRIGELIRTIEKHEREKQEAAYQTLQAQVNPHFLYNTLESIEFACLRRKENHTAKIIAALVRLLRFNIRNANKMLSLQAELDYIRNYCVIEQERYGNAFQVEYEIEKETDQFPVPGFILQPFVENAIVHGFDMSKTDNRIRISSEQKENGIRLCIWDNGIGMSEEIRKNILSSNRESWKYTGFNSIGIKIVDTRLKNLYREGYRMEISSTEGEGTVVVLEIPATTLSEGQEIIL